MWIEIETNAKQGRKVTNLWKKKNLLQFKSEELWRRGCDKTADCAVSGNYTPQSAVYCWVTNSLLAVHLPILASLKHRREAPVERLRLSNHPEKQKKDMLSLSLRCSHSSKFSGGDKGSVHSGANYLCPGFVSHWKLKGRRLEFPRHVQWWDSSHGK